MLMKMRSKMQNQKGFTLVELMVVVVILGILVAIAVPVYNNVTKSANQKAVEANLRTIDGAVMQYEAATTNKISDGETGKGQLVPESGDKYLREWPTGPDHVVYSISSGKATATAGTGEGTATDTSWFGTAPSGGYQLPITTWP